MRWGRKEPTAQPLDEPPVESSAEPPEPSAEPPSAPAAEPPEPSAELAAESSEPPPFDRSTLGWLDRLEPEIDSYASTVEAPYDLRSALLHFAQFGYVVLPGIVPRETIDGYLDEIEQLLDERDTSTIVEIGGLGQREIRDCTREQLEGRSTRIMDFHNQSRTGKSLALHPTIISLVGQIFRDEQPLAMHTLTFMQPTGQRAHQDAAYVVPSKTPARMMAAWIALEDVHPDAGPVFYYPGSHTIRRFDWGDGPFLSADSRETPDSFADYLEAECDRTGLRRETFCAQKGDVLFWHGSLVHGGSPPASERTRKSFVTHYSTLEAHPLDRRFPDQTPAVAQVGQGFTYIDLRRPDEEDTYPRPRPVAAEA